MQRITFLTILSLLIYCQPALALNQADVPSIYKNIAIENGQPVVNGPQGKLYLDPGQATPDYTLQMLAGNPVGTQTGFTFTFKDFRASDTLAWGTLFYSLWDPKEGRYPMPHYNFSTPIDKYGKARVDMSKLTGRYDLSDWEASGKGILYYRVTDPKRALIEGKGSILYEGKFFFTTQPFKVGISITAGPWVANVTHNSAVVAFETNRPVIARVTAHGRTIADAAETSRHEIKLTNLPSAQNIAYTVKAGDHIEKYAFTTAPEPGTRSKFVFAYSTDCRNSIASGERTFAGVNAYIMRKVMALTAAKNAAFLQFTGDTMSGYDANVPTQRVKYAAFQRTILPWASHLPVYTGMGNHEVIEFVWDDKSKYGLSCDRFPFATDSAEAVFADVFVNPENGPLSEDRSFCDPNPAKDGDFPPYKENVYYYTWDNVAMIVLNSQYLYSPSLPQKKTVGGNLWGYIMDNQLEWLKSTLSSLQADSNIDHIFVTHHTPVFPNGGHVEHYNSMWMKGENLTPIINGTPVQKFLDDGKGSLDRRDEFIRTLLSHTKVKAILVGDEHNYSRLLIKPGMPVYKKKGYRPASPLNINRNLWHITVGSAGAPYYAMEPAPWNQNYPRDTQYLKFFSPQHAVAFFHIHGPLLKLEVVNPDTLDRIE
jgi:hypothetical protein